MSIDLEEGELSDDVDDERVSNDGRKATNQGEEQESVKHKHRDGRCYREIRRREVEPCRSDLSLLDSEEEVGGDLEWTHVARNLGSIFTKKLA